MDSVDISLITCGPGPEIYSLYGHTALRIENQTTGEDIAVNWGIFNTRIPNFVLRFMFGLTDYQMALQPFSEMFAQYTYQQRWMLQQHLSLSPQEKLSILQAIAENNLPENRVYRYNYFYDNCTTRARDMILRHVKGTMGYDSNPVYKSTYRKEIHEWNEDHRWARVGNDLLLGYQSDRHISREEQQFLPDSLRKDFDHIVITNNGEKHALVDSTFYVIPPVTTITESGFPLQPVHCALILLCIVIVVTVLQFVKHWKVWPLDALLMLASGIGGILLFAMVFSQHPTVRVNLQILVLNPVVLIFMVPALRRLIKGRCHWLWKFWAGCIVLFFLGNIVQNYAEGMNLVALALLIRCLANIKPQCHEF